MNGEFTNIDRDTAQWAALRRRALSRLRMQAGFGQPSTAEENLAQRNADASHSAAHRDACLDLGDTRSRSN